MLRRHAAPLALAVAIALFPLSGATFYVELTAKIMIMAIFALSLDLLVGWTGLVSFGHAAFFGVGAYALAILSPKAAAAGLWSTLALAIVAAALCALVVGVFVLRTRGIYFIMVTLAFAQMFYFVFHDTKFGGGSDGRYVNLKPDASILGFTPFDLDKPLHVYYAVFALLLAVWIFLQLLLRSPFGRALQGIRANEQRMRALGFPVTAYKLAAFTLAGAIAGLSGYLLAAQTGFVNPEILSWHQSGNVLLMVILGGAGTPLGPVVGAFALTLMHEFFSSYTRHWQLFLGAAIVLIVLFMPGGLGHLTRRVRRSLFGGTRDG
ncbi:MAG: branched-chain amino acid ABC transporter permease [Burkholderiales bacterium]|nr:branched-chain amino acid ABC transporter permease [Burkholderiales bacterium]MCC7115732.1 branched-chain amino acid ABC transporter permease [Burkholderiales bacterium]